MSVELVLLSGVSCRGREVAGPRLRGLLALLAADLRAGCGTAQLVADLWPDEPPAHPAKAVQILVSRLRSQFGADLVIRTATGYRLALRADQVDAAAAREHAAAAQRYAAAGDHAAALSEAAAGLALWDGPPDWRDGGDPLTQLRARWAGTYWSLARSRALALSRSGRFAEARVALAALADQAPSRGPGRDEEVLAELLRAEAGTLGPAAALRRFEAYRRRLREELGADPGATLQGLHRELLQGELPGVVRHGISYEPNPLLGRERDLAAVTALLETSRVVSIVGAGGLGKTRLAHAVSRAAPVRAVYLVALAGVAADADVPGEVASALGVGELRPAVAGLAEGTVAGIREALGPGPVLLVLDNCEHVLDGAAALVAALVASTRQVRVLATSRAPLGLSAEAVHKLPPLAPATAAALFGQRARAARPDVALPADLVAEVCDHLDGLPLAVELAAARVRTMSVAEIAQRLDDRFALLRGAARDAPARHHTLHAVVDWSWHLLTPAGRAAMRALSVFPGGFTIAAARHLLGGGDPTGVLEDLVDQSLLAVVETGAGTRFRMLETVREFSAARRDEAGETGGAITGLLAWARELGVTHHDQIFGSDPLGTLAVARAELDNLLPAMRHAVARGDGATLAAVAALLGGLWTVESQIGRMATLVEEAGWLLSHYRPDPELVDTTRTALALCAAYAFLSGGPRRLRPLVALRRLPPGRPDTLTGAMATVLGASAGGLEALLVLAESDQPLVAATANGVVSYLWEGVGEPERALAAAGRALDLLDRSATPWLRAAAHARFSELCLQLERPTEARHHLAAALPVYEQFGVWSDVAGVRYWMVLASLQLGDVAEAERWFAQAPPDAGDSADTASYGLGVQAELQLARGEVAAGLALWRRVTTRLAATDDAEFGAGPDGLNPWTLEALAVTVVAHARHGRTALVEQCVAEVRSGLAVALADPAGGSSPFLAGLPVCGTLLLAVAAVEIDRASRTGDAGPARTGARLVALAERAGFLRNFQPTMSSAAARRSAIAADRRAYQEAAASYAELDPEGLRAAARAVLREAAGPAGAGRQDDAGQPTRSRLNSRLAQT